jgi:hypothetical protein
MFPFPFLFKEYLFHMDGNKKATGFHPFSKKCPPSFLRSTYSIWTEIRRQQGFIPSGDNVPFLFKKYLLHVDTRGVIPSVSNAPPFFLRSTYCLWMEIRM